MEQKITSTTTKGLIIGLILVVLGLAMYFLKIDVNGPMRWVQLIIFVAGIIWAVMTYGKQLNYNSTFGNYFAHGFKVAAVATVILIIYLIIFNLLFPDFKETAIEQARKKMSEKNNMTPEQIDQAITITKKFFMVFAIGGLVVVNLICGAIAALIGAGVTKKEPQPIGDISQIGK